MDLMDVVALVLAGRVGSVSIETLDNPGWSVALQGLGDDAREGAWLGFEREVDGAVGFARASELGYLLSKVLAEHGTAAEPSRLTDSLVCWYARHLDGDWEHDYGISIRAAREGWSARVSSDGVLDPVRINKTQTLGADFQSTGDAFVDEWVLAVEGRDPAMSALGEVMDELLRPDDTVQPS